MAELAYLFARNLLPVAIDKKEKKEITKLILIRGYGRGEIVEEKD